MITAARLGFAGLPDPVDAAALRALATALWDQRSAIAAEWTRRLLASVPRPLSDEVSVETLTSLNEAFLTLFLQQAHAGDLVALCQSHYEMNYRLIEAELQRAPDSRMSLESLYTSARISAEVIASHLGPAPHDLQLAWSGLTTRLAMVVGLAYSDCREEHIQQNFTAQRAKELQRANQALHEEIARRQSVEDSLRREKTFADTTLDSLPGIFYLFDMEGRFLRWNRNFEIVSGYDAVEIAHLHPIDLFDPDEKTYIADAITAVFEAGAATAEAVFVSKDGTRTPHFFTGLKVVVGEEPCLIGMGIDISERKVMEEALHASAAELARSNQIKTYFAATISHELRNTFNAIMIANEAILLDSALVMRIEHRELLKSVQRRVREAIQIIHATLELTHSEMQPGADGARVIDVGDVVAELAREVALPASRADVVLEWNVPSLLPPFHTDPVKLKMILKNLIENALKFTPEGRVDVIVQLDDGHLCCTVADNGVGIPAAELGHIFEPFHRADARDQRRVGGTGLGLYIVRRLVDLLGGTIDVHSAPDRGTTFVLRVPAFDQRPGNEPAVGATKRLSNG